MALSSLYQRFVTLTKEEGIMVALRTAYNFFTTKWLHLKYLLLLSYYNTFHHGLVLRKIQGNKMYLSVNDRGLSRDLLFSDIREPLQTNLVKQLVEPGMTVVDIGANLGYYVLIEAAIVGATGKVYAVEPIPQSYEILKKNVYINKYENIVETHLCAISDTNSVSTIAMAKQKNFSTMFLEEGEMSGWMKKQLKISIDKILDVKTFTLDKFLADKKPVDFIRMDVEGYEGRIIKGMLDTVKNSGSSLKLFMEMHPGVFRDSSAMVAEIIRDLTTLGFKVKFIVNTDGTELLDFSEDHLLEILCSEWAPGVFLEKT